MSKTIKPLKLKGTYPSVVRRIRLHGIPKESPHLRGLEPKVPYSGAQVANLARKAIADARAELDSIEEALDARNKDNVYQVILGDNKITLQECKLERMSNWALRSDLEDKIDASIRGIEALREVEQNLVQARQQRYGKLADADDVRIEFKWQEMYSMYQQGEPFMIPVKFEAKPDLLIGMKHREGPSLAKTPLGRRIMKLFDEAMFQCYVSPKADRSGITPDLDGEVKAAVLNGDCHIHFNGAFYRLVIADVRVTDVFETQVRPDIMECLMTPPPKEKK